MAEDPRGRVILVAAAAVGAYSLLADRASGEMSGMPQPKLGGSVGGAGGALVFGLAIGGATTACSFGCNPLLPMAVGVALLNGATLLEAATLGCFAVGFSLPLAAGLVGVGFGIGGLGRIAERVMPVARLGGAMPTRVGDAPPVKRSLSARDHLGSLKARSNIGRRQYRVPPGLYAVGEPSAEAPVLVSAHKPSCPLCGVSKPKGRRVSRVTYKAAEKLGAMKRLGYWSWITLALSLAAACTPNAPSRMAADMASGAGTTADAGKGKAEDAKAGEPLPPRQPSSPPLLAATYEQHLKQNEDISYDELVKRLPLERRPEAKLDFDPMRVDWARPIIDALKMTETEKAVYRTNGFVVVDHHQPYSMGSAYYAIYTKDLPVLVTTDSILHALHKTYDDILKELEVAYLAPALADVLDGVQDALAEESKGTTGEVRQALEDVDLYVTVARNLVAGAGAQAVAPSDADRDQSRKYNPPDDWDRKLLVESKLGQDQAALAILKKVAELKLETPGPESPPCTSIHGGSRCVDYSQFEPRGHYTKSTSLKRYFRAMMWLGRSDTGFNLNDPEKKGHALDPQVARERRGAAALAILLDRSDKTQELQSMGDIVDFMVGRADSATLAQLTAALKVAKLTRLDQLADDNRIELTMRALAKLGGGTQQIKSQVIESSQVDPEQVEPPELVQTFGQRFVPDSFALSKVVFDSIVHEKEKRKRMMPSGLDVMATLGNDEAVALLEPELKQHRYSDNLLALRKTMDEHQAALFNENLYGLWLGALRELDEIPDSRQFPRAMRSRPWQHKMLHTQLASWAELRHDTILYAKQSYTAYASCEYPKGYVEPYPTFYAKVAHFAEEGARRLDAAKTVVADADQAKHMDQLKDRQVKFLTSFAATIRRLERLASKELAAESFTKEEEEFLKKTIDRRGGGSGPPRYDGWYPDLFYGREPVAWEPIVADVHTNPSPIGRGTLEVATGNPAFMVVAVDNQNDRTAYVGPVYSYYEFVVDPEQRLDDEQWQQRLQDGKEPPRPEWTKSFLPRAPPRRLGR